MSNIPKYLLPQKNKLGRQKNINQKPRSCLTGNRKNDSTTQPQKTNTESDGDDDDPDAPINPLVKIHNYDYEQLAENLSKAIGMIINPVVERHGIHIEGKQKI